MKRKILFNTIVLFMLTLLSCISRNKSDGNYLRTEKISEGLFIEHYEMKKGGVFEGNTYACFLTDSNGYCEFIFFYDDNDIVKYDFIEDGYMLFTIEPDEKFHDYYIIKEKKKIKIPSLKS